ncbi:MAG: sulfite exporter TauE/SafE family protein [Gammaproteobacteria bacterium]|nr:sulfite exporter TauE/SafE family protein [Gammaproteobacteria bacterium]MDH5304749.1 sulfite exporter TauE/SafE family protein [Gammaproteobacteria bacterium]MDH5322762.1 sulfite exporter TauE/SafE family protein [Gammaproteobacteria bacterium]
MDWMHTFAGLLVGTVVGLTGVGGGALMTPILVLLFGVSPALAVGTDLWFAALTKTVGGFIHQQRGSVEWSVLRRLCLGSLPTSVLTLSWLHRSGIDRYTQGLIMTALGCVLLLTAVAILFRTRTQSLGARIRTISPERFKRAQPALTVVAGSILGLLVTLTSVGGGALGIVMLVFLYPFRLTPTKLVGTDIVHAIPLTLIAGSGYLWMGNVDLSLLGKLLLGSVPGVILGSMLSARVAERPLRIAIAIILSLVGIKLLL